MTEPDPRTSGKPGVPLTDEATLRTVAANTPAGILEIDEAGSVAYSNPAAERITGRSLVRDGWAGLDYVHPDDRQHLLNAVEPTLETGQDFDVTVRYVRPDGVIRWLRVNGRPGSAPGEDRARFYMSFLDVTDGVDARLVMERLAALLEATTDVVAVFQPDGELFHLNRIGRECLGLEADAALDRRTFDELLSPGDREAFPRILGTAIDEGIWRGEASLVDEHRGTTPVSLVVIGHNRPDGTVDYLSAIARDVSDLKAAERALAEQATHDSLTGLPNRLLLLDRLRHALERSRRQPVELAVLYVDLDRFKVVNDSLGHVAGDRLLVQAAERLRGVVRSADTLCRLGGDEFVVLCEDLVRRSDVLEIARRVVDAFERPFGIEGAEAYVTASVGVALGSGHDDTAESILRDADVAMYRAKDRGRSRFEMFDGTLDAWATDRYETEAALRRAIRHDELTVAYQPIVELATGEWTAIEALARWNREGRGPVPPARFVPLAEEMGVVGGLGAAVLRNAASSVARWNWRLRRAAPLALAVNVSGRQLGQPGLVDEIREGAETANLDPSWLILEVTESALIEDPELAQRRLAALKELGVRVAIDDFGTGYSGLVYLQQFPLDIVKIDQRFVQGLGTSLTDEKIVASIISLAHDLGYVVVAEGVEESVQHNVLVKLGCDCAQGFRYARPQSGDRIESALSGGVQPIPGSTPLAQGERS